MIRRFFLPRRARAVKAAARSNVRLNADDRVDVRRPAGVVELKTAIHVAVVGRRDSIHAGALDLLDEPFELRRSVERRVRRVAVQMSKRPGIRHRSRPFEFRFLKQQKRSLPGHGARSPLKIAAHYQPGRRPRRETSRSKSRIKS